MRFIALILVILVVVAMPGASADSDAADGDGATSGGQEPFISFCIDLDRCLLSDEPAPCRLWEWYDDDPQVSVNPLLGLIVLDPDGCLRQKVDDLHSYVLYLLEHHLEDLLGHGSGDGRA